MVMMKHDPKDYTMPRYLMRKMQNINHVLPWGTCLPQAGIKRGNMSEPGLPACR